VIIFLICAVLWSAAYIATLRYFAARKRLVVGGVVLFAMSLLPTIFGRATTPEEWHDYPLMGIYYLPTLITAFLSITIVTVGLFRAARRAFSDQTGTR
jgi:hypothetical protein